MAATLTAPANPDMLARLIAALRVRSGQRRGQNPTEVGLAKALSGAGLSAATSAEFLRTLDHQPRRLRVRFLGNMAKSDFVAPDRPPTMPRGVGTVAIPTTALINTSDIRGRPADTLSRDPDAEANPTYTIRYRGFFCEEETNWDRGSGSDEVYFTASTVHIENGQNVYSNQPLKLPVNQNHYGDVDTNEAREGPVVALWHGGRSILSLTIAAMEYDDGDPEKYRDKVDSLVKAAIAVGTYFFPPAVVLASLKEQIADAINWLLGSGDDLISVEVVVLTPELMDTLCWNGPSFYSSEDSPPVSSNLIYHFTTSHSGGGAKYVACFDIERNPPRQKPPIFL